MVSMNQSEGNAWTSLNTGQKAQLVIGWALTLLAGLFGLITLFTFPFVLADEGTSAIWEAVAFIVPEAVGFGVGIWLIRRSKKSGSGQRPAA